MKQISFPGARARPAASPAVAGFRPVALAMTMASAFASGAASAQPSGHQAIHGSATVQQQGSKQTVTTQNGDRSNHSVIQWQSFSVPGSTTTHFAQPNAASTSINRVVGNNLSQILGTLSSNGKLVLVNPAGITVGAGAMVDTAGFTASTLRMSDADALAGRLVFGDGTGGGALNINGHVLARHGDVVLVAPDVQVGAGALVKAPNGATLLAAGQKVAVTGRGLEGIQLEMQAPADQALNLGTLQGDAVGVFAGTLKHSGAIQATGVSIEGGRVVLKGSASADIAGTVAASKGTLGGSVHATANKVMLRSGAVVDVSGSAGGGEALIGGGWQGGDARIANSIETTVEQGAIVRADAVDSGNGGTVVAWSDGATRMAGAFSARGGAASGNGGKVEVSGHYLDFRGTVDTRAANGSKGQLLLDPTSIYIANDQTSATSAGMSGTNTVVGNGPPITTFSASGSPSQSLLTTGNLSAALEANNVTVTTASSGSGTGFIKVVDSFAWTLGTQLTLLADANIMVNAPVTTGLGGGLNLVANTGISIDAPVSAPSGTISLRSYGGNITQSQALSANALLAIADAGSVSLGAGNAVPILAGYAGNGSSFTFANSGALTVGSVNGSNGVGQMTNTTSLTAGGDLTISDTNYGVRGSFVYLNSGGSITQSGGGKLETPLLQASATNNLFLTNINAGGSTLNASSAGPGATLSYTQQSGNLTLNGSLNAASIYLTSAGNIQRATGLVNGNYISLDANFGVGTAGSPIRTAGTGTTMLSLSPGSSSLGSAGGYVDHSGSANLNYLDYANTLSVAANSNLGINANVNVGTGAATFKADGTLTKASSVSMDGGSITLIGNQISLLALSPSYDVSADTITVQNYGAVGIELGSASIAGAMQIDATELALLNATGTLRIGSTTATSLYVGGAVSMPGTTALALTSGGNMAQAPGAIITGTELALKTNAGSIILPESNMVNKLAAHLGISTPDQSLHFNNGGALQVASVDGINGINVPFTGSYGGGTAGVISLLAGGPLSQAPGALLSGAAVAAQGTSVALTQANPTGVIAGRSTGSASTDTFAYTSSNGIFITSVAALTGITHDGAPAINSVQLSGTHVMQDSGGVISSAGRLQVTAASGGVGLNSSNSVASLQGSAATGLSFTNATGLATGPLSTTSGLLHVEVQSGLLSVGSNISAGAGIQLLGDNMSIAGATLNAGAGMMELRTNVGDITFDGSVSLTAGGGIMLDPWGTSVINSGTLTLNSTINPGSWYLEIDGGTLNVASDASMPYLYLVNGTLTGNGNLTVTDYLDWEGGSMTGTGTTTLAAGAFGAVYGSVFTSRPMVNVGDFALGYGGSIGVGPGFSLQNNGIFTLEEGGGFAGGAGTIVNNGIFRKGVAPYMYGPYAVAATPAPAPVPTTATVDVGSFVNTSTGSVEVLNGDTLVFPGNFTNNSGIIGLDAGSTLDTMGGSLTSSGMIKGNGTLMLGGGTLTNLGKIAPGGEGSIGTLMIQAQTVNLEGGTLIMADIADTTTYDVLQVSGDVVFKSGVTVAAITSSAPALGDSYDIVRSSSGTVSGTPPVVSTTMAGVHFDAALSGGLRLVAATVPAHSDGTTTEAEVQATSLVVQFLAAFERTLEQIEEEEDKLGNASANDNLVNDTSCKPAT